MANVTSLTQKGQVTVPVEYRRRMGLKTGQKVRFEYTNGALTLKPFSGLLSLIGIFKSPKKYNKRKAREVYIKDVLKGKI